MKHFPSVRVREPVAHPHTVTFQRIIDRMRLPDHEAARLKWLAWCRWSSRSCANIHHLTRP